MRLLPAEEARLAAGNGGEGGTMKKYPAAKAASEISRSQPGYVWRQKKISKMRKYYQLMPRSEAAILSEENQWRKAA